MGLSLLSLPSAVRIAVSRARKEAAGRGFEAVITSTFRTRSEQEQLFDQFQLGNRIFPVARPGTSRHEFGLAVDMVALPASRLPELVNIMRSVGFRWAGPSDTVHFDYVLPLGRPGRPPEAPPTSVVESVLPPQSLPIPKARAARPGPPCCCL